MVLKLLKQIYELNELFCGDLYKRCEEWYDNDEFVDRPPCTIDDFRWTCDFNDHTDIGCSKNADKKCKHYNVVILGDEELDNLKNMKEKIANARQSGFCEGEVATSASSFRGPRRIGSD